MRGDPSCNCPEGSIGYGSGAGSDQTTSNSYDAAGRLVRVEKTGTSNSRIDFEYDAADRIVKETQTFEGRSQVLSYGYDSLDRRISRKLDDADEVRYDYDLANRQRKDHRIGLPAEARAPS